MPLKNNLQVSVLKNQKKFSNLFTIPLKSLTAAGKDERQFAPHGVEERFPFTQSVADGLKADVFVKGFAGGYA